MKIIDSTILKPGRYINGEWNSVHKEWKDSMLKIVLAFPDIYEIGMSHLGMKILYGILNREKDILCERVFAPWDDMEKNMRLEKKSLLSLESGRKLKEFDIVGFSLQYEMSYTDVLNMLELGEIPVLCKDRGDGDPVVIAGGPCVFNPAPMTDFIDAFVIGEGEEVVLEIAKIAQGSRLEAQGKRKKILKALSEIHGIYVPAFSLEPLAFSLNKRIVKDLDNAYFPTDIIVPYIQTVHDRVGIEIMRGCPHKCKFCQARGIFHPLRIRSVKRILEIAEETVKSTGYEKISLLSLSSGDYPYLDELIVKLREKFRNSGVKISLPSLRVRDFENTVDDGIMKRSSLTFAPECGSDRLRASLNKSLKNEDIIEKSNLALKSGWKKVKLYFMLGLPGETYEDIDAIAELVSKVRNVNASVSNFIPKPYTDFENEGMDDPDTLKEKKKYLYSRLEARGCRKRVRIDFHDQELSRIEAVLCKGDKAVGKIIYRAWKKGARLQAWEEYFNYKLWRDCFEECGVDPGDYLKKSSGVRPLGCVGD
jgi:radical SAM family uncharacterized protein